MKTFRSIAAVILAFLVLVAASHFEVGIHYCSGSIFTVNLLAEADGCGMEKNSPLSTHYKTSCCSSATFLHEASETVPDLEFASTVTLQPAATNFLIATIIPVRVNISVETIVPPLLSKDRIVTARTFRI